jgi:DNA-binding NarL/FixJ family response regulator
MKNKMTVLIVDDHPLVRKGLRDVIEEDGSFEIVGEVGDGDVALKLIEQIHPELTILDINLPGISGLEVARRLNANHDSTRVVILTMHKEEEVFNKAMNHGVKGYLLKENALNDIIGCLQTVAEDDFYISSSLSGYLLKRRERREDLAKERPGLGELTPAERRILKRIADCKTSKEIADELFISHRTVEAHRSNICSKLNVHGTNRLFQFAIENRSELF